MAAFAGGKARGAGRALALHHAGRAGPFGAQARPFRTGPPAAIPSGGRRACSLAESARSRAPAPRRRRGSRRPARARSHRPMRWHSSAGTLRPGEDDVERPAPPDDARQPHGAAVDQRHAPAPAINAHVGALLHHAQVAPQRELHAARDRGTRDRGDHRLGQLQPRRPHRAARNGPLACAENQRAPSDPSGRAARPRISDRSRRRTRRPRPTAPRPIALSSRSNASKRFGERLGARRVHRVARFDAVADERGDRAVAFDVSVMMPPRCRARNNWPRSRHLSSACNRRTCEDIMRKRAAIVTILRTDKRGRGCDVRRDDIVASPADVRTRLARRARRNARPKSHAWWTRRRPPSSKASSPPSMEAVRALQRRRDGPVRAVVERADRQSRARD